VTEHTDRQTYRSKT